MTTENETEESVSKSQRKRDADTMQALGERLTKLRNAQLNELPLSEKILDAINEYNRLPNNFGAKRRQMQFIGRIMRESDYNAIVTMLDKITSPNYLSDKSHKRKEIEKISESILTTGDQSINAALLQWPQLDRQQLRQLYREYQRANEKKKLSIALRCKEILRNSSAS